MLYVVSSLFEILLDDESRDSGKFYDLSQTSIVVEIYLNFVISCFILMLFKV